MLNLLGRSAEDVVDAAYSENSKLAEIELGNDRRAMVRRLWAGYGADTPCDFCRRPIARTEVEYEVEAAFPGEDATLHFHRFCYYRCERSTARD